jgi:hypothetical protein
MQKLTTLAFVERREPGHTSEGLAGVEPTAGGTVSLVSVEVVISLPLVSLLRNVTGSCAAS